jgi:beta-glucosidase
VCCPGLSQAVSVASASDTVILALGEIRTEGEGHDRASISLSDAQQQLTAAIYGLGKPTLLVISNGCSVALDGMVQQPAAIVEAFDPGHNAPQLAELLFGEQNR